MSMRRVPLLLFMAVLLLPLFAQVTRYPQVAPLEEYRTLAEWPQADGYFAQGRTDFLGYTAKLNTWHLDNFATRAFWVRLRTQALFTVFRQSDQVHIGPNGWLFYRRVIDTETPMVESIPAQTRHALVSKLARLTDLLDQRDIQLYVMPLALKHRYYPEFLPDSASHARRFRYYDQLMDELVANGRVRVVDSRAPLTQAKRDGMKIFHQTDFHWTDPAGAVVVGGLLRTIAGSAGRASLVDSWRYEIVEQEMSGGQGRALPLLRTPRERTVMLALQSPQTRYDFQSSEGVIEWSGIAQPDQSPLLPPILAYGDSFLDAGGRAGFFYFFEAFAVAKQGHASLVQAYQQRHPDTRYLLIEWITSGTFGLDTQISELVAALESEPSASAPP